jgi:fatty acid desaturase
MEAFSRKGGSFPTATLRAGPGMRPNDIIRSVDWPTLALATLIHGGWLALTWWHALLPWWALTALGGWFVAWHGSLQHEIIHGHPTGHRRFDDPIASIPLSLWLPYPIYRRSHLDHHAAEVVTDPLEDPESRYRTAATGAGARFALWLDRCQATLAGRLLLGPAICVGRFAVDEAIRAARTPRAWFADWWRHLIGVAAVLLWLRLCGLPLAQYLAMFVYPGLALTLLRSFAEHRAGPTAARRVAVVESRGLLALLFLNNNLHAAHHWAASVAWYRLPALYRSRRAAFLASNGGLVYHGYRDIVRRYALRPHDDLVHPDHRTAIS